MKTKFALACMFNLSLGLAPVLSAPPPSEPTSSDQMIMCASDWRDGHFLKWTYHDVKWNIHPCIDGKSFIAFHRVDLANQIVTIDVVYFGDRMHVLVPGGALDEADLSAFATFRAMTPAQTAEFIAQIEAAQHGSLEPAGALNPPDLHLQRTSTRSVL